MAKDHGCRMLLPIMLVCVLLGGCQDKWGVISGGDLLFAAWNGDMATVKSALERGVDVNSRDQYQATSLMYAAHRGHLEIARLLIAHNADVNAQDQARRRAKRICVSSSSKLIVKV